MPLALAIHALCDAAGLPNYVKTSGQSGLHVLIPLGGQCTFEQARMLAYLIGQLVERRHPDMATTARNPAARRGRVYLDWGQNAHGQLLVVPFSVRPVPGAPVSMPLVWDEVVPGLDARQFHVRNALDRVTAWPGDPCLPVLTERPDLAAALARLEQVAQTEPVTPPPKSAADAPSRPAPRAGDGLLPTVTIIRTLVTMPAPALPSFFGGHRTRTSGTGSSVSRATNWPPE